MSGSKLTWFLCRGVEIGSILEWRSNWLDYSDAVDSYLIFVWGVEFDLVLVGIEIDLLFVQGVGVDCVRAEIDYFLVWWLIDLFFSWVVEIDLVF